MMAPKKNYTIYSHADADGGIAAGIFSRFLQEKYSQYGWSIEIESVNHVSYGGPPWNYKEISWPCAILDFTLHPTFLSERFFRPRAVLQQQGTDPQAIPPCYWLDHHPTGSDFPFLNKDNAASLMPQVVTKWDTQAVSTPGLLRTHYQAIGLPLSLIQMYEEYIDLAEIIDGALYATCTDSFNFSTPAVKLQTLFSISHPAVNRAQLYKRISKFISTSPSVEQLLDSDFLYAALLSYEEQQHFKQLRAYEKNTKLCGKVAYACFINNKNFAGFGRFIPYCLHESAKYALHVYPKNKEEYSLSCGVNPWNKPQDSEKHLGHYFAKIFAGGGHAFVAGGKVNCNELEKVEQLLAYLNS